MIASSRGQPPGDAATATLAFVAFGLSGAAGLIYEAVWSKYLALFLGHSAHAQTLVLVLFMGGLSAGSWLAAHGTRRWRRLFLGYAVVEGLIGIAGIGFHTVYEPMVEAAYRQVIPLLGSGAGLEAFKWLLAMVLIGPQTVLLGMTFPLLGGALLRRRTEGRGRTLAVLYFINSLGAALGVLLAGFVLVPAVGLPGAMLGGGVLNILAALAIWVVARADRPQPPPAAAVGGRGGGSTRRLLLTVAALTGLASLLYEIGWIRMLSLVLGATTHAFELMLSSFVAGLAIGGLWVRSRIDSSRDPIALLAYLQIAMGLLAAATLILYPYSFDWMGALIERLPRDDAGYVAFNIASHAIALAIMLPATICAGATLPIITFYLLGRGAGESEIGTVYALNTVGAIAGVVLAVHLLMPWVGLAGVVLAGAAIDVALGVVLLGAHRPRARVIAAVLGAFVLAAIGTGTDLDPRRLASGVYRYGDPDIYAGARVAFHRDATTASVAVLDFDSGVASLTTNGKPDASLRLTPVGVPSPDEYTMVLLGALPFAAAPHARRAAVVGFGSGLTTHTLLAAGQLERVDTVEIEPAMLDASRHFMSRVARAYEDPRSHVHIGDARTFFADGGPAYDIVVSEPSTTWVSGISGLFTAEFYAKVAARLAPDGVFAQWLHLRELSPALVASVFGALSSAFGALEVYMLNDVDILILAGRVNLPSVDPHRLGRFPGLRQELAAIDILGPEDIRVLRLATGATLAPLLATFSMPPNSDYFPILDVHAVRTRFLGRTAQGLMALSHAGLPIVEMLEPAGVGGPGQNYPGENPYVARVQVARVADALARWIQAGAPADGPPLLRERRRLRAAVREVLDNACPADPRAWIDAYLTLAEVLVPHLPVQAAAPALRRLTARACDTAQAARMRAFVGVTLAAAERDADALSRRAETLLEADSSPREAAYLVRAALLGHLAGGRRDAARRVWERHQARLRGPLGIDLHLLVAHARE